MLDKIFSLLGLQNSEKPQKSVDTEKIVREIRLAEEQEISTGKRIYAIDYMHYNLILDREFTGNYRISVFTGNHKIYGFSITEEDITDKQFATIWDKVIAFLKDDPSPQTMPDDKFLKTHFFGNP